MGCEPGSDAADLRVAEQMARGWREVRENGSAQPKCTPLTPSLANLSQRGCRQRWNPALSNTPPKGSSRIWPR